MIPLSGMTKLSTCDWEGKIVATVFSQGCPLRCLYCHNPDLIPFSASKTPVLWDDVMEHMLKRRGLLDGLVFSGGEPTVHSGLSHCAQEIKDLGYVVGVHTSGMYPNNVKELINQGAVDWVGLDIKTSFDAYADVVQVNARSNKVIQTLDALQSSKIDFELRTTIHSSFIKEENIENIVSFLASRNIDKWVVQKVRNDGTGKEWEWSDDTIVDICRKHTSQYGIELQVRG
jgi:pyruvate formate lyase activating enzyme